MASSSVDDDEPTIQAVAASLTLVETLATDGAMTITELAEALDRSPSNVLAHLRTLQRRGFVVGEDGRYRPGLRYYEIGNAVRKEYPLFVHGREPADELAAETGEFAWLMVAEQGRGYYLYKTGGQRAVESGAYTTGSRWPLNATASGKVVLAHMDADERADVLEADGLTAMTPQTITDREALLSELDTIRERGYALDEEESAVGICGVAAPVCGIDGVIGTVSVSGPASRIKGEYLREELPERVVETADVVRIKYNGASAVDGQTPD